MTYKEAIQKSTEEYVYLHEGKVRFLGYNTAKGSRMYGTLEGVKEELCLEMPVCENLMIGMGMGMALDGFRPVVCFERHDFLLLALDGLVNHIDKMPLLSGYQYTLPVLVRAIVGSKEPLNPGPQHTQDYTRELRTMLKHTPVYAPTSYEGFKAAYDQVGNTRSGAVVVVEYKDRYGLKV